MSREEFERDAEQVAHTESPGETTTATPWHVAPGYAGYGAASSPWSGPPAPAGAPGPPAPGERRSRTAAAGAIAAGVLLLVGGAGLAGYEVGRPAATAASSASQGGSAGSSARPGSSASPSFPSGVYPGYSQGGTSPGGSSGGSSSGSSGPSDASSIASRVDPGLVDVNTTIDYGEAEGAGTGMVLTSNGEILTNNHVIDGATSISVTDVGNGRTYSATVVGYDVSKDVAVLQLSGASGLKTVETSSGNVSVGEQVVGIGNAGGSGGTPSYAGGSVTATGKSITASDELTGTGEHLTDMIETNADIIAGDSGGPLVNTSGQVIGMDTAGSSTYQLSQAGSGSDGFAIPISVALGVASQIEAHDASSTVHVGATAFLGVEIDTSSSGSFGYGGFGYGGSSSSVSGAEISGVVSGSPAAGTGLGDGDVITSVGGHAVTSDTSLQSVLTQDESPGRSVTVRYVDASGAEHTATVVLSSGPPQ